MNSPSDNSGSKFRLLPKSAMGRFFSMVLLSGWMFFLGVLVGRGTAPVSFDINRLEVALVKLRDAEKKEERKHYNASPKAEDTTGDLQFYEVLKKETDEGSIRHLKKAHEKQVAMEEQSVSDVVADDTVEAERAVEAAEPAEAAPGGKIPVKLSRKEQTKQGSRPQTMVREVAKPLPNAQYTIQVAAFRSQSDADKLVGALKEKGYPAFKAVGTPPGDGTWYRVRIGSFVEKDDAKRLLDRLKQEKRPAILVEF